MQSVGRVKRVDLFLWRSRRFCFLVKMSHNNRQRVFIEEYLQCWNASEAARRAGYSLKTAYSIGQENLKKPEIKEAIEARIAEKVMSANEVLDRLSQHARGSMEDFIHPESMSVDLAAAQRNQKLHLIKKVKYITRTDDDSQTETVEFELYDAQAALVKLGQFHRLFIERVESTGKDGGPIEHKITGLESLTNDDLNRLIEDR